MIIIMIYIIYIYRFINSNIILKHRMGNIYNSVTVCNQIQMHLTKKKDKQEISML